MSKMFSLACQFPVWYHNSITFSVYESHKTCHYTFVQTSHQKKIISQTPFPIFCYYFIQRLNCGKTM